MAVRLEPGLEIQALATGPGEAIWAAGIVARLEEPVRVVATRLAPTGRRTTVSRRTLPGSQVGDLIRGPENSMWLSLPKTDEVVRVDADRDWQVFQMPEGSHPTGLAVSAGVVWVTLAGRPEVAMIDPSRPQILGYPLHPGTVLTGIESAPGGLLWAIATDATQVVRFSPGGVTSYFKIRTGPAGQESKLNGDIAVGYGGSVWVSQSDHGTIEKITGTGDRLHSGGFFLPGGPATVITAGPARDIWFINGGGQVGSIAPDGEFGERRCATDACSAVRTIASGPDGTLWFATDEEIAPYVPRPLALKIRNVDGHIRQGSIFMRLFARGGAAGQICRGRLQILVGGRRIQQTRYPLQTGNHAEEYVALGSSLHRLLAARGRLPVVIVAKVGDRTTARREITLSAAG